MPADSNRGQAPGKPPGAAHNHIISDVAARVKLLQRFGDTKRAGKDYKFCNVNNIINETLLQLHHLWKDNMAKAGKTITIKTDYGNIPEIFCNEGELKTSFHNIVKNSIEAMPEGGNLCVKTRKRKKDIRVSIADTGIGMDETTRLKIFSAVFYNQGI